MNLNLEIFFSFTINAYFTISIKLEKATKMD